MLNIPTLNSCSSPSNLLFPHALPLWVNGNSLLLVAPAKSPGVILDPFFFSHISHVSISKFCQLFFHYIDWIITALTTTIFISCLGYYTKLLNGLLLLPVHFVSLFSIHQPVWSLNTWLKWCHFSIWNSSVPLSYSKRPF